MSIELNVLFISIILFFVVVSELLMIRTILKLKRYEQENFKTILKNCVDIKVLYDMFRDQTKINDLVNDMLEYKEDKKDIKDIKKEPKKCNCGQGEQTDDKKERY